jgi:tetratricopeptide (TPR) repeat protein
MTKHSTEATAFPEDMLAQSHPALYHTLGALNGDAAAQQWLAAHAVGLYHLTRAITGEEEATDHLASLDLAESGLLVEIMENPNLREHLRERHPLVCRMLEAGAGNPEAERGLRRQKGAGRLIDVLRQIYQRHAAEGGADGAQELTDAAAEVGLLVGEMHLRRAEYERAIAAFTRAIEVEPSADAYDGRARAYRALASLDDQHAARLRR